MVELLGEADEGVPARRAELGKEGRLVGLDPGVDELGALDGGGLLPALAGGRDDDDAVLAGRHVLEDDLAVGYRWSEEALSSAMSVATDMGSHPGV